MTTFIPELFTTEYYDAKNILSLCYDKYFAIGKDVIKYIKQYLKSYAFGFAHFNYTKYTLICIKNNNTKLITRNEFIGHPFEVLIKILSKFNNSITNDSNFNKILQDINNTLNYTKIHLMECLKYIINKDYTLIHELFNPSDFSQLYSLINTRIANININRNTKRRICIKKNNKYVTTNYIGCLWYYLNNNLKTLEEYIIENSIYHSVKKYDTNKHLYYEKQLIINSNIILLEILRFEYNNKSVLMKNKVKIPYILDLPEDVFENEIKQNYELYAVVIYDDYDKTYSCIIKENNKYYHYLYNIIIECDDNYFNKVTISNAINIFYKLIIN